MRGVQSRDGGKSGESRRDYANHMSRWSGMEDKEGDRGDTWRGEGKGGGGGAESSQGEINCFTKK